MNESRFDLIVIGCGSAGLSVGLFMAQAGFRVLMVDRSDHQIGGECLNDGCVPSKALIHVARIIHQAHKAKQFGLEVSGLPDIKKATQYVYERQEVIRKHENAGWLQQQGVVVALGEAHFIGANQIEVGGKKYSAKRIVIATGSKPAKLMVPGVEQVRYYDNEDIFQLKALPRQLLVVGSGPVGIEIAQAMTRLGSKVTVVSNGKKILEKEDDAVTEILLARLEQEGIDFYFEATIESFPASNTANIQLKDGSQKALPADAVFVAIGREIDVAALQVEKAGIAVKEGRIVVNDYLRTTNPKIFVCGDVAGSLQFSHEAEFQARILLNNFFSPLRKKLNHDHISWVTFTDPEVATFGLNEQELKKSGKKYRRLEKSFSDDDRAVTDDHQYGKLVLFISQGAFLHREKILGGTMIAPNAGELIQELVLANTFELSINKLFNKIYAYPVASRINQKAIVQYKQEGFTNPLKQLLRCAWRLFS